LSESEKKTQNIPAVTAEKNFQQKPKPHNGEQYPQTRNDAETAQQNTEGF